MNFSPKKVGFKMMEYKIYRKRMTVTKNDFFRGNYNFVEGEKGELIACGANDEDQLLNIFSMYNNPMIMISNESLLIDGYWMQYKDIDEKNYYFAAESDFQEIADELGIEEE